MHCEDSPQAGGRHFEYTLHLNLRTVCVTSSSDAKHSQFADTDRKDGSQLLGFWNGFIGGTFAGLAQRQTVQTPSNTASSSTLENLCTLHTVRCLRPTFRTNSDQCLGVIYKLKNESRVCRPGPAILCDLPTVTKPFSDFHETRYSSYFKKKKETCTLEFREVGLSQSRVTCGVHELPPSVSIFIERFGWNSV
jgi:hypothetical protein